MNVLFHAADAFESLGDSPRSLETARRALEAGFPLKMMEDELKWQALVSTPEFREMVASLQIPE